MAEKINALNKFHFLIVDENDNVIESGLRVSVFIAGSSSAATIYADQFETALTNPITGAVFTTNVGKVEFWYGGGKVDIVISDGIGRLVAITDFTSSQNRIVFDSKLAVSGVIGNVTGTDLADVSATFVDYAETVTLDGRLLRAGDIINIGGWLVIDDYYSAEELDFKIKIIDGTNDPTILHTSDMVPTADNQHLRFDSKVKILAAGASGKIIFSTITHTNIAGTWKLQVGTIDSTVTLAGASLLLDDDIIITASGDYITTDATQESQVLWDVSVQKGVVYTT